MLFLDGVYVKTEHGLRFRRVSAPTQDELHTLVNRLSRRVARFLVRQGLLVEDIENSYLQMDGLEASPMQDLLGHSITYRVALGPQEGRKVFTLQTIPAKEDSPKPYVANESGFNLHAGVVAQAHQRDKLERLCRYITRPAISEKRLSLTPSGHVRYALKTPYRDGTTHVIFEPLDFMYRKYGMPEMQEQFLAMAKLAALIPRPRMNLTRYYGVFAPNHRHRSEVTPGKRGAGAPKQEGKRGSRNMSWAKRLRRVFAIDIQRCQSCDERARVIACIEDPLVIAKILEHLRSKGRLEAAPRQRHLFPDERAPPMFGDNEIFRDEG